MFWEVLPGEEESVGKDGGKGGKTCECQDTLLLLVAQKGKRGRKRGKRKGLCTGYLVEWFPGEVQVRQWIG